MATEKYCVSRPEASAAAWLRRIAFIAIAAYTLSLAIGDSAIAAESGLSVAASASGATAAAGPVATAENAAAETASDSAEAAPAEPCGDQPQATAKEPADESEADQKQIEELIRRMEEELRKELEALKADPAWKPSHETVRVIRPCDRDAGEVLLTFCSDGQGRLLAGCYLPSNEPDQSQAMPVPQPAFKAWLRVLSPDGKQVASWELDVMPSAVCVAPDGTIFVGGDGRIAKLSAEGKVLAVADTPGVIALRESEAAKQKAEQEKADKARAEKEGKDKLEGDAKEKKSSKIGSALLRAFGLGGSAEESSVEEAAARAAYQKYQAGVVTGLAANDADVFLCGGMPEGFGYAVWRMDHDLKNPRLIVKDLRGCCGQMDIQAEGGRLWIPVNGEHKVKCYDRDGKELLKFGKRDRKKAEGFGGCCEPKNLRPARDGSIFTAESGPPVVVKRFDASGKLLGVVALPDYSSGCVRVTVAASPDESEIYLLNTGEQSIHVFADKRSVPTHEQTATIDFAGGGRPTQLNTFCVGGDGRLYAACGRFVPAMSPEEARGSGEMGRPGTTAEIRVFDADGKPQTAWQLDFTPQALASVEGGIIVAGDGRLAQFDFEGTLIRSADAPHVRELPPLPEIPPPEKPLSEEEQKARAERLAAAKSARDQAQKAMVEKISELRAAQNDPAKRETLQKEYAERARELAERSAELNEAVMTPRTKALQARAAQMRQRSISAVTVGEKDVFIACPMTKGFGFAIWRTDRSFGEGRLIAEGLRGCCGQMDIQARGEQVFVAENARKRVVVFDRDGKQVVAWGESQRAGIDGFGSCCNPMNLRFNTAGELITSEASLGRLKRYSPEGQLLGLVGIATVEGGCKNVAVDLSPDAKRCYVMDLGRNRICVLTAKAGNADLQQ